ncbi:MAG TPA: long-chain fatty acid--CoA ligase [Candidatus Dormibacteraeota bacterium]|jgi:long-chain acyl-CoA synthetase|nr:long-chain fatty acid--CoA ligase [Candidatus Dormibacteraeota bacterium]
MTVAEAVQPAAGSPSPDNRPLLRPPALLPLAPVDLDADTMVAVVVGQAQRYGDRVSLTVKDAGARWYPVTWREQNDSAVAFAAAAVHAGVAQGDRVALLAENRLEWLTVDVGTQLAGAVTVPIYASSTADMVEQILVDSEAVMVVCSTPAQAAKVNEIRDRCGALKTAVLMEGTAENFQSLADLAAAATHDDVETVAERAKKVTKNDPLTIIYTSGTTGVPKGVVLTHGNIVESCRGILDRVPVTENDQGISFLPWAHVYERVQGIFAGMMAGVTAAVARDISDIGGDVRAVRPTLMNGVPRVWEKMQEAIVSRIRDEGGSKAAIGLKALEDATTAARLRRQNKPLPLALRLRLQLWERLVLAKVRAGLGGRMRVFSSGGGPIGMPTLEFFDGLGIAITEGYGLTETSGGITANDPRDPRFGTVGRAIKGHEVRIAQDGEILVKGPAVMQGYFRNQDATNDVLKDGWFATGDIGELDAAGYLRITDRKKDLIVTAGGKNIAPQPIESLIAHDPLVVRAAVIGDKRKYLVALIVPDFDNLHDWAKKQGITARDDSELVKDRRVADMYTDIAVRASAKLARYETIKRVAVLDRDFDPDQGELTPTLKVKRRVVAEHFADVIESLYS